jgi:hypothetical protein
MFISSPFSLAPSLGIREWNLLPASVTDADKLEEFRGRIQNLRTPLRILVTRAVYIVLALYIFQ